jgi:U3 small nucleolar RNA-associated protein 3
MKKAKEVKVEESKPVAKKEKKSVKFDNLKMKSSFEDPVYQEQTNKIKGRKDKRQEAEKDMKIQRDHNIKAIDKDIQRRVQKNIIKNRGLTRNRKKIDSNGRVKKRMKYEKMEKKRKNVVKSYEEGPKGPYKGEGSGIKTGLDRGIKM